MATRYWTDAERKDALHLEWEEFHVKHPEREFDSYRVKRDRLRRGETDIQDGRLNNGGQNKISKPRSMEELKQMSDIGMVEFKKIDYVARIGSATKDRGELIVAAGDFQFPFEDGDVFSAFLTFLAAERPDQVVLTGDILDLTAASAFERDPRLGMSIQDELQHSHNRLAEIRASAGKNAKIVFIYGNHEARMSKWLARKAPELVGITDVNGVEMLSLSSLLRLERLGIEPAVYDGTAFAGPENLRSYYQIAPDLIATHGTYSRTTGGGASIMPIVDAAGVSVVGGHDHSQGLAFKTVGGFAGVKMRGKFFEQRYFGDGFFIAGFGFFLGLIDALGDGI
jgi:predicted phosphodiesterase